MLHAHLPFVRHPEHARFLEEDWLFEGISESYLPLLRVFNGLESDRIPFRLTVSISPTLASMLADSALQQRYADYQQRQLDLAERELDRTSSDSQLNEVAAMYVTLFRQNQLDYENLYKRNLVEALAAWQRKGNVELITTAATHAFLPFFAQQPSAVEAQIAQGVRCHRRLFSKRPSGFWLPECGYFEGVEGYLQAHDLPYFITESHAVLYCEPRPKYGVYAPVQSANRVAAFARDPRSARSVWSATDGYPAHPSYRDFYRDIGFDLPADYLAPYLHGDGVRSATGIKYYAITGDTEDKRPYQPEVAADTVRHHARNFLQARLTQIRELAPLMDRKPFLVCPYDAELFGHWWFEGPRWIDRLFREAVAHREDLQFATPGDYLATYPDNQPATPSFSSWGDGGYAEVWLDESNDWVYPHLLRMSSRMEELVEKFPRVTGLHRRALNQAAREILLSQASDWAFIMKAGTAVDYAVRRTREHIENFNRIYESLLANRLDVAWLGTVEARNNLFPDMDYRLMRLSGQDRPVRPSAR